MTTHTDRTTVAVPADLLQLVGKPLGTSDWRAMNPPRHNSPQPTI
ncbi:hypothetical protein [Streptomyces ochraceiscleroticus]|uniref:Uncharacterized protein n=1 Tax=Streptomyces ochraceiscleroticus TaxID=47761 RepID=A0ABW1MJU3_9ACTN|nr:hypothetical protein [Streptomyces ochraceiscleroticus]